MCASLLESVLFFLIKEAHFYPCSLQVTSRCVSRGNLPVIHQKEKRNYIVLAQWLSRETGKVCNFQETYKFLRGILGFRPKINRGDVIPVKVIFNEHTYRIKRK
jgi:hypothetical protein